MTRFILKCFLSYLFYVSGRARKRIVTNSLTSQLVLTYHRVLDSRNGVDCIQEGMFVDLKTFEMHLHFLKENFNIKHLFELEGDEGSSEDKSPKVFLTFDDGWVDFYDNVYPLLVKYSIPATVFLPTKFIGTNHAFWTDRLFYILKTAPQKKLSLGEHLNCLSKEIVSLLIDGKRKDIYEDAISICKRHPMAEIEDSLSELESQYGVKNKINKRSFLDIEEIKKMKASGLISYGSHTVDHCILTNESDEVVSAQLKESYDFLLNNSIASKDFIPFCYPNGNSNPKIVNQLKPIGYSLAFSTVKGWHSKNESPYLIRRVSIHQDISSSKSLFACRLAGIF